MRNETGYSERHGSPYDRGSADAYYGRAPRPHYFIGESFHSPMVTDLTEDERAAYMAGYTEETDRKDWG